jgi:hypothetical protein
VKSSELAAQVGAIVGEAQSRITGIGSEQYETEEGQKFERMALPDLLTYFEEELLDQINYSVMNILRLRWLQEALDHKLSEAVYIVSDPDNDKGEAFAWLSGLVKEYEGRGRKKTP